MKSSTVFALDSLVEGGMEFGQAAQTLWSKLSEKEKRQFTTGQWLAVYKASDGWGRSGAAALEALVTCVRGKQECLEFLLTVSPRVDRSHPCLRASLIERVFGFATDREECRKTGIHLQLNLKVHLGLINRKRAEVRLREKILYAQFSRYLQLALTVGDCVEIHCEVMRSGASESHGEYLSVEKFKVWERALSLAKTPKDLADVLPICCADKTALSSLGDRTLELIA